MAHCGDAGETRTLHPLSLPDRLLDPGGAELRRGLYVDRETTGFSPGHDAVIELAMLPFTYTLEGSVVEILQGEAQVHRNDPGRPRDRARGVDGKDLADDEPVEEHPERREVLLGGRG